MNELPAGSGFYPHVLVNNAGGEVRLLNLSIDGSDALFNVDGEMLGLDFIVRRVPFRNLSASIS